jgi:integrase
MAHRRAWLVKRVKADGVWTAGTPIFSKFGSLTRKVKVRGVNRQLDGVYVVEYYDANGRRQRRTLGSNEGAAERELKHMQRKLADAADGHPVTFEIKSTKHPLERAVREFVAYQRRRKRTEKTIRGTEKLLALLTAEYLEDLSQKDVTGLLVQKLEEFGYSEQTVYDRFAKVVSFLKWCEGEYGVRRCVTLKDGPVKPRHSNGDDAGRKDPYTDAELAALNKVSTTEERLYWLFLLQTGCREGEMIHATWSDLNLEHRLFYIRSKDGFRPKDKTDRTVPFGQELADALKQVRKSAGLIFPKNGKVQRHIIRILKKRAAEAGLNPDDCNLHKFRHTFACKHAKGGVDPRKVQQWMGHSELETTLIYFDKVKNQSEEVKALVDRTFATA